jgi:broad-specificity NMP kinase
MSRSQPNILITGTPGTGKTTTSEHVSRLLDLKLVCLGDWVKAKDLHNGWDEEFQCYVIDEDKVAGGYVRAGIAAYHMQFDADRCVMSWKTSWSRAVW